MSNKSILKETKKYIAHYNYVKNRGDLGDTTEDTYNERNRVDDSSYSFSTDFESRKGKNSRKNQLYSSRETKPHYSSSHSRNDSYERYGNVKVRPSEESVIELGIIFFFSFVLIFTNKKR